MKRRFLACMLALTLSTMGLGACGGSQKPAETQTAAETEAASSEAAETEAVETEAPVTELPETEPPVEVDWTGDWTATQVGMQGAIVTGDLSALEIQFTMTLNEDGSATLSMNDDAQEGIWSENTDGSAALTISEKTVPVVMYDDGSAYMTVDIDDSVMNILFKKGTEPEKKAAYDPADAEKITDPAFPAGSWKALALYTQGICVEGDLSVFGAFDLAMELKADGTGTMSFNEDSSDLTWTIGEEGLSVNSDGTTYQVLQLGEYLVFDFGDDMGGISLILTR